MYFPRNKAEEVWAADKLPVDTGNALTGEPVKKIVWRESESVLSLTS